VINIRAMQAAHARIVIAHERALDLSATTAGKRGVAEATSNAPKDTGKLSQANKYKVIRTSRRTLLRLSNPKKYAASQDKGARAHVIKAKGGGYLHFKGSQGWVRKRQVNHPGNPPTYFLRNAANSAFDVFGHTYTRIMRAATNR
jgi:hypothetical protein